jgi:hypothetical protein
MITKNARKARVSMSMLNTLGDIEVMNPIESKSLFGGNGYSNDPNNNPNGPTYNGGTLNTVYIGGHGPSSGTFYGTNNTLNGGFAHDWNNYGGNNHGSYGGGGYGDMGGANHGWIDLNGDGINDNSIDQQCQLNNLPQSVNQQIGNLCTMESMAFIANLLGSNATLDSILTSIGKNPQIVTSVLDSVTLAQQGLTITQLSTAVNSLFFNTVATSVGQIQLALCNGQPALTTINGNTHAVTIVGYDSTTATFTVADSQWATNNGYHNIPESSIDMQNTYIITGTRP